jgi:hypothetical protein
VTDPLAASLKELRLMQKEMAANKAEFDHRNQTAETSSVKINEEPPTRL